MTPEHKRLALLSGNANPLAQWGPYLSERQWGTVREDYSHDGNAWQYFPFDHAHCRAYQWGEDGIAGISDIFQNLCFSVAMWNGKDPILKERLFGLRNGEGNHGEDVKELYYHLDNLPTHYYMEYLYKYPQREFPYQLLREENGKRSRQEPEYEILDTGIFNDNQYFDIRISYAKQSPTDLFIKIDVTNRYHKQAQVTVLPTLWFFNRWSKENGPKKPEIRYVNRKCVATTDERLGNYFFYFQTAKDILFTENETNTNKVMGIPSENIFSKDAFHDAVINGKNLEALKARKSGTKFSPVYRMKVAGGATKTIYCRLCNAKVEDPFTKGFEKIFVKRKKKRMNFMLRYCLADSVRTWHKSKGRHLQDCSGANNIIISMWKNGSIPAMEYTPVNPGKK